MEGHEAYGLMSSKINPRVKELKRSENFRQRKLPLQVKKDYFCNWQEDVF